MILNGTVIFEIPIYSMPKDKFDAKWQQKRKLETDDLVLKGWEREKAERQIRELHGTKQLYKYNQIVGYIAVVKEWGGISFELWISANKQYRYDTPRQNNIRHSIQVGQHFRLDDKMNNAEIADKIYLWLKREAEDQKERHRHLDLMLFEATYKYIDYKTLFAEMKEQNKWTN